MTTQSFAPVFVEVYESYKGYNSKVDPSSPDMRLSGETVAKLFPDHVVPNNTPFQKGEVAALQLRKHDVGYIVTLTARGWLGFYVVGEIHTNAYTPAGLVTYTGCGVSGDVLVADLKAKPFSGTVSNATTILDIFEVFRKTFLKNTALGKQPRKVAKRKPKANVTKIKTAAEKRTESRLNKIEADQARIIELLTKLAA